MVLIVKKFVKIYPENADVPVKFRNLRKNRHVKTFSRPFPNIPEILVNEYGLSYDDKIIVFHTKTVDNFRGWRDYRTPFKKIYYGTVYDFKSYLKDFLDKIRKKLSGRK